MKSGGPYKIDKAAEPVGAPDMSSVNEGRHRWGKLVVVPLRTAVSSRRQSTGGEVDLLAL